MSHDANLSDDERRLLSAVLDEIIPPSADGRLRGAGESGLVDEIEAVLRESPDMVPAVRGGLSALAEGARERGDDFVSLGGEERRAALDAIAAGQPAFVPSLVFHVYTRYYMKPAVLEGLGMEPRPPHPLGYPLETGDLGLLEPVRQRGRIYREV